MSNLAQQMKQGAGQALASLSQGWREIKDRANGALTHFRSSGEKGADGSGENELPALSSWGFMAADVVDGKDNVVVRLEAPGMSRSGFSVEVVDDTLRVQGEKRIEREFQSDGHHTIQSAYGSFRRDVPLPGAVNVEKANATYRDGVLRIVFPKVEGAKPRRFSVQVN